MTVKLPPLLEQTVRERSAAQGRSASELIREALQTYLAANDGPPPSAWAAGEDLFGRHRGPANLAGDRKRLLADAWAGKHGAAVKRRS